MLVNASMWRVLSKHWLSVRASLEAGARIV